MPIFDYVCSWCTHEERDLLVGSASELVTCANCGGPMDRLPAAPAFTVKGYNAKNGYGDNHIPKGCEPSN